MSLDLRSPRSVAMAVHRYVFALVSILVLLGGELCAADAGERVLLGSDLGVAQQVTQVQRKLHDAQEKLEAAESRSETLEKHAEVLDAELKATKESAEKKIKVLEESKNGEEEAASGRLRDALGRVDELEQKVVAVSAERDGLQSERTRLLQLAGSGEKLAEAERRAQALEVEAAQRVEVAETRANGLEKERVTLLERLEAVERKEAAQREGMRKLREETEDLRRQTADALTKVAELEVALRSAHAELSAKEQVLSGWLPPWAAAKINPLQEAVLVHWFKHGQPVYRTMSSTVAATAVSAHKWADPHLKTAHSAAARVWTSVGQPAVGYATATHQRVMPVVAAEWAEHVTPWTEKAHAGAAIAYSRAATLVGPHAAKAQQGAAAALKRVRKHPRFSALEDALAPSLHRVWETMQPLWEAAIRLHYQAVQTVLQHLADYPVTAAFATGRNARMVLYVLLAIPAVFILALYPALSKKIPSELSTSREALSKKKRKLVPGKPGQGASLGKRPSGVPASGGY